MRVLLVLVVCLLWSEGIKANSGFYPNQTPISSENPCPQKCLRQENPCLPICMESLPLQNQNNHDEEIKLDVPIQAFVMIGAIVAAFLTGLFNITNIVISKEKEITDYRQKWLENINVELSEFLGQVETLTQLVEHKIKEKGRGLLEPDLLEFRETYKVHYEKLNQQYYRVTIRLDPKRDQELLVSLAKLYEDFFGNCSRENLEIINNGLKDVAGKAQEYTTKVWKLVKQGEPNFRKLRKTLIFGVVSIIAVLVVISFYWFLQGDIFKA